jgi:hypothetical protein
MTKTDQDKAREKIILKEQFEIYLKSIINESIDFLASEMKSERSAGVAMDFQMALAKEMGGVPYFGDPTTDPAGYRQWKDEGKDKYSPALIALRNTSAEYFARDVSTDEMMNEKLNKTEENLLSNVLVQDDFLAVSGLFLKAVLDMVKVGRYGKCVEKAKVIDQFLSYWGKHVLTPQHQEALEDLSQFMKGDFDDFANGKRKLSGSTPEKVKALGTVLNEQKISLSL